MTATVYNRVFLKGERKSKTVKREIFLPVKELVLIDKYTLLKKFKGAHTLWQIAVKTDIPSFDTKIQNN